jgi:hypothetical protein
MNLAGALGHDKEVDLGLITVLAMLIESGAGSLKG